MQVTGIGEKPDTYTVSNILTQGSVGDLDFPLEGKGQHNIKWSFVPCPQGAVSRRMLET